MVLAIGVEGKRQSIHVKQNDASMATKHKIGPSLQQPAFNWSVKDKYAELKKNFKRR